MKVSQKIGDILWIHAEGRTFTVNLNAEITGTSRAKSKSISENGVLVSPMPGKILRVEVKLGEKVSSGKTVCVIEAMKMEYALKAPFDGNIRGIFKKEGDLVILDEKVIEIEKGSKT